MLRSFLLLLLPLLLLGCSPTEQPITKEESIALGKRLQASIEDGHPQLFDSLFLNKVFADQTAKEVGVSAGQSFAKDLEGELVKKSLGRQMLKNMSEDDSYEFLHQYEKNNRQHLLFRIYGNDGINYNDIELVKLDGRIGLADMYIYLSGENISKTFGRAMGLMLSEAQNQSERNRVDAVQAVQDMRSLMNNRQYEEANQLYEKLPQDFKKERAFQLMHISITSNLDMEKYKQALAVFEKQFGHDPSAQLSLFDYYFLNEQYEKTLKVLDVLDAAVKDPLLNFHRSLVYSKMNDKRNAIKYLELLYKEKPDFGDGVLELIARYIEANEKEKATNLIAVYRSNKKYNQQKLKNLKFLYPDFISLDQL